MSGAPARLAFAPRVERDLRALDRKRARQLRARIVAALSQSPPPANADTRPLRGVSGGWQRLRVGDLRVIWRPEPGPVHRVARIVDRRDLERAVRSLAG